jgi:metal-sulfur cluster biosynthetic enzyme
LHIALLPCHPSKFTNVPDESNTFDLDEAVAETRPLSPSITARISNFRLPQVSEKTSVSDMLMLKGKFGNWNFKLKVKTVWHPEWEVAWIVKERKRMWKRGWKRRDGAKFLVRWRGTEPSTWEPESNLRHAPKAIANWRIRESYRSKLRRRR